MTLKQRLLKHLNNNEYSSLETLYEIGRPQKIATTERTLRAICEEDKRIKPHFPDGKNYIVGYMNISLPYRSLLESHDSQKKAQEARGDVLPQNTTQSPLFKLEPLKAIKKRHYEYN